MNELQVPESFLRTTPTLIHCLCLFLNSGLLNAVETDFRVGPQTEKMQQLNYNDYMCTFRFTLRSQAVWIVVLVQQ